MDLKQANVYLLLFFYLQLFDRQPHCQDQLRFLEIGSDIQGLGLWLGLGLRLGLRLGLGLGIGDIQSKAVQFHIFTSWLPRSTVLSRLRLQNVTLTLTLILILALILILTEILILILTRTLTLTHLPLKQS
jgi:hypothetical protein